MGWDSCEDPTIIKREQDLEDIEKIFATAGYALNCDNYYDDCFLIKNSSGKTIACLYDYELLPRYDFLKRKGSVTAEMLLYNSFSLSPQEQAHIKKYRNLDTYGQETINLILNRELDRVEQLQKASASTLVEFSPQEERKRLVEYFHSVSAGTGVFILGNEATDQIAIPDTSKYKTVDFATNVNGKSMEPNYMNGDIVLVSSKEEMKYGDVGIFIVNNEAFIKEYGEKELISRNPDCNNIKISEYDNIVCMGKVIDKLNGSSLGCVE